MAGQCVSGGLFGLSAKVGGRGVKVVDPGFKGAVYKLVYTLLVHYVLAVLVLNHLPAHTTVAKQGNLVSVAGVDAVFHLALFACGYGAG